MSGLSVIAHTDKWIRTVVIGLNFCPFAAKALLQKNVEYVVVQEADLRKSLEALIETLQLLEREESMETAFLLLPGAFEDFDDYLDLLDQANALLDLQGYEGIYQLASFHPAYCFDGADMDDPANFTTRSPYPMLHLLREASVEKAVALYKDAHLIPDRNVELARQKGLLYMQALRMACFQ